jgi:hypothetical protein
MDMHGYVRGILTLRIYQRSRTLERKVLHGMVRIVAD